MLLRAAVVAAAAGLGFILGHHHMSDFCASAMEAADDPAIQDDAADTDHILTADFLLFQAFQNGCGNIKSVRW